MIEEPPRRINLHLILTIFLGVGMVLFGVLAVMAYMQRTTALDTLDQQVSTAVTKAKIDQKTTDESANAKANQLPYKTYLASQPDGAFQLQFPKNWSVYTEHADSGTNQLLLIAGLDTVNVNKSGNNTQVFKLELQRTTALAIVKTYDDKIKAKKLSASTMKVSGIDATVIQGVLDDQRHDGVKVIVPVRDKALVFTTENRTALDQFNQILITAKIIP